MTSFGARIRALRAEFAWSLSTMSEMADISRSYLYQIESDTSSPTLQMIEVVAEAFAMSVPDLIAPLYQDVLDEAPFPMTA